MNTFSVLGRAARVAKGDFSPVDGGGHHIEEVAGLLEARRSLRFPEIAAAVETITPCQHLGI